MGTTFRLLRASLFPLATLLLLSLFAACGDSGQLILATTTSTQDSGLLDTLVPMFQRESGYSVKTIAVGSGQALRLGAEGEADVILAHSPEAEEEFMRAGDGSERLRVMYNEFVIVGPPGDPAGISGEGFATEAFSRIAESGQPFISRGDQSGTHAMELGVWDKAGINPEGQPWYQQTGQGMGATLAVANEKRGYTLTDRGTYLSQRRELDMEMALEGDPELLNVYHVIVVNAERRQQVNSEAATAFARFLVSDAGQEAIGSFGFDRFGEPLFIPDAER